MKRVLLGLLRFYQIIVSPLKNALFGTPQGCCRFHPTCSEYAIQALKEHGVFSGGWLALKRICRCHPWGGFGDDPVPKKQCSKPHEH